MRDTASLRATLALLAGACYGMSASGCADPPSNIPRADPSSTKRPADKGKAVAATVPADKMMRAAPNQQAPVDPAQARFMPIAGDPPYIDGYNPEEESCPSGNWCGASDLALAIAPNDQTPAELGCPVRIVGAHKESPITDNKYPGLSTKRSMQGALNTHGTQLRRGDGEDSTCCYHWFEYCSGRPLRDGERTIVARPVEDPSWSTEGPQPHTPPGDAGLRRALADAWLEDALAEHASVAAFARVAQELMSVGAPPQLLAATQRAGLDEIRHARDCFALASAYAGAPVGPGPLPAVPPRTGDLADVARWAFEEGCVSETVAALTAERGAARCQDPSVRAVLERIARDEARHAALAWQTVGWALSVGGDAVVQALESRLDSPVPTDPPPCPRGTHDAQAWAHHGRLDAAALAGAADDAWREIIVPTLRTFCANARQATRSGRSAPPQSPKAPPRSPADRC